jgi:hypothetical protein
VVCPLDDGAIPPDGTGLSGETLGPHAEKCRRARQRKSAIVDLRALQAVNAGVKCISADKKAPELGGLFVRHQAWVGLSVGATAAERGRRGSNDAMGQRRPS